MLKSPVTGRSIVAVRPSGATSGWTSSSEANRPLRSAPATMPSTPVCRAARSSRFPSGDQTTTVCAKPVCGKAAVMSSYVFMMGIERGSESAPASPVRIPRAGRASATMASPATSSETSGLCSTTRITAGQNRPAPSLRRSRCTSGTRGRSIRSPSSESIAGSTVSEPSTATATTSIVPMAIEAKVASPESSSPDIAMQTARPETTTARPLVRAAVSMASARLAPRSRSSRARRT